MKKGDYRVVLVCGGKVLKVYERFKYYAYALKKFNKYFDKNQVFYEKKHYSRQKSGYKYEMLLVKKLESGENVQKGRKLMTSTGEIVEEKVIGNWKILKKFHWKHEEKFYVFGLDERLDVADLLKYVFMPRMGEIYKVIIVNCRMVIYNEDDIEVFNCKNVEEANRIYKFIVDFFIKKNVFNFLFLGNADKATKKILYPKMLEHTGIVRKEIYRKKLD